LQNIEERFLSRADKDRLIGVCNSLISGKKVKIVKKKFAPVKPTAAAKPLDP
jgi:hypothetical protein